MEIAHTALDPKRNFGLVLTRFQKTFRFADAGFFINFLVVYIFAFISLYPKYGLSIIALMPLIVVTAGWFWGVKGGFLGGLLSFPLYYPPSLTLSFFRLYMLFDGAFFHFMKICTNFIKIKCCYKETGS